MIIIHDHKPYSKIFTFCYNYYRYLHYKITYSAWQLQFIDTEGVGFIRIGIHAKKFLYHSPSLTSNSNATNSDSIVELAIMVCFAGFHVTAPP